MAIDERRSINRRLIIFYLFYVLLFSILISGLFYRQVIKYGHHKKIESRQNNRRIIIPGPRGDILDRDGKLIVGNRPLFNSVVFIAEIRAELYRERNRLLDEFVEEHPGEKINWWDLRYGAQRIVIQRYLDQFNDITGRYELMNNKKVDKHFYQDRMLPLPLVSDLASEEYARLVEQLPSDSPLQVITDSTRYYPYNETACHALGYVRLSDKVPEENLPGKNLRTFRFKGKVGVTGLEKYFDESLQGKTGGEIWVVDPSGYKHERIEALQPVKGKDLRSSIDIDVQIAAEEAMGDKVGAVIALHVQTGEVIAMASKPSFDLNKLSPYIPSDVYKEISAKEGWLNRPIQGLYPPGSTYKLLTQIALLQSDTVVPSDEVDCQGAFRVGRRKVIHCHSRWGHGPQDMWHAIANSCNVYYYELSLQMGIDSLVSTAEKFGFGNSTGIELKEETRGMVIASPAYKKKRFLENWYDGDTTNAAIGQGFNLFTPLQLTCFIASLARGETKTVPTLAYDPLKQNRGKHGGEKINLAPEQLQAIYDGMRLAVIEGTAKYAQKDRKGNSIDVNVAGKTGTSQIRKKGKKTTLAWVASFAPYENPELAVVVLIEGTPEGDIYHGGSTAAPIARVIYDTWFKKHPAYGRLVPYPQELGEGEYEAR